MTTHLHPQMFGISLAEFCQIGVTANTILKIVFRLTVSSEVDGLGLRMQIHNERDDRCREVTANIVCDVSLSVILVDFHNAIHRLHFVL